MNQYGVKPEIEVFDLAMLYNAVNYVRDGVLKAPLHVQFVLGVKHALPAERDILEFEVAKLQRADARRLRGWRPASAAFRSTSTSGAWRWAATAARGSKTTCGGTSTASPRRTPSSWRASPASAPSTGVRSRRPRRRDRFWGLRAA
jgi:hypothetical protein